MRGISRVIGAVCVLFLLTSLAGADQKDDVLQLYRDFASAQNARDIKRVRQLLSDAPDFLWVSDGRPVWGADAMVARMSMFQKSDVWRVEPALDRARAISLSNDVAILHLPLALEIGERGKTDRLLFLVGMVAKRTVAGWRIAALFTTGDKSTP